MEKQKLSQQNRGETDPSRQEFKRPTRRIRSTAHDKDDTALSSMVQESLDKIRNNVKELSDMKNQPDNQPDKDDATIVSTEKADSESIYASSLPFLVQESPSYPTKKSTNDEAIRERVKAILERATVTKPFGISQIL